MLVTVFCVGYVGIALSDIGKSKIFYKIKYLHSVKKFIKILIIYKLADFERHSVTAPTLDKLMSYTIESLRQFECR